MGNQKLDKQVNMHSHLHYSNTGGFKDSTNKCDKVIKYVSTLGQKAVAFTEHEMMGGHLKCLKICEELKANGEIPQDFKVILGNEIYLVDEEEMKSQMANKERVHFYHFILLALDDIGHRQLRELSTRAWSRMFSWRGIERKPTYYEDIEEIIGENQGHVVASTACLGGLIGKSILNGDTETPLGFIEWCQDVFGKDNFFLEMQPHERAFDENGQEIISEQRIVNEWIIQQGLPTIITTDAHYLAKEHRKFHKAYLTSDNDEDKASVREVDSFYATTYHMDTEEIHSYLNHYIDESLINQCIDNAWDISQRVKGYNLTRKQAVTEFPLPPENEWFINDDILDMFYDNEKEFNNCITMWESDNLYNGYLISLCMKGASDTFLIPSKDEWWDTFKRVNQECEELLGISEHAGYNMSAYSILIKEFIDMIWDGAESILAPSRGSALGYMINYLLGIVQVNPLKAPVDLPHWRFIHKSKPSLPDVDLDTPGYKKEAVFKVCKSLMEDIGGTLVRVGTFKTETTKSAIQTACRGMGVDSDTAMYLSSLIPVDRGAVRSLKDTVYGNEEHGIPPHKDFIREVNKYEGLLDVIFEIEGLISGRSSHAGGVVPHTDFLDCCGLMKAPNGDITTQYDLSDVESCGGIKYDFLSTSVTGMILTTLNLLVEYGHIEKGETLRDTYRKSIHPNNLDFDNPKYYDYLNDGKLLNAFQFDTLTSIKALHTIKPQNLLELANTNSLMRLMGDGEQPTERYVRLRNHPEQWEEEMISHGLNEQERAILHKHLDKDCGTLSSQEGLMLLSQDPQIAGFDIPSADTLRKGIAKKNAKALEKAKKMFYERGKELGTRKEMLDYVWNVQFAMQFGYAFSILHTIGYSILLLQQLELATSYPPIYWATAVLMTESGTVERESEDGEGKESGTDGEAIGIAIANLQKQKVCIALPSINEALAGFKPDEQTNSIIFGMKGISGINNKTANLIIEKRPFDSMIDFYNKMRMVKQEVLTKDGKKQMKSLVAKGQMISLIKAGAFDKIEPHKSRTELMEEYLLLEYPNKKKLTTSNLEDLINRGLIPSDYDEELRYYDFREYLRQGTKVNDGELYFQDENYKPTKSKKWYLLDGEDEVDTQEIVDVFFEMFPTLQQGKHWEYVEDNGEYYPNSIWVECGASSKDSFEGIYKTKINRLVKYLSSQEVLDRYNESLFSEVRNTYMSGSEATWEFETMNHYQGEHEVAKINKELYNIKNFHELDEQPKIVNYWMKKDKETGKEIPIPIFEINQICGVVLGKNKNKNIITLLTETGTVYCKFQKGQFSFYDRTISIPDEQTGKTKVVEKSWLQTGNILMIRGIRRDNQFTIKNYKNSLWSHSVSLVEKIYEDGIALTRDERYRVE